MRPGLLSAICLTGMMAPLLSHAGNLDRCDLARITAHNEVMDTYSQVFSELASMTSPAKSDEADPTHASYTDKNGEERIVDMIALTTALHRQEAADLGRANKDVAGECGDTPDALKGAVQAAVASARRDISAVLSKHLIGADLSRLVPKS